MTSHPKTTDREKRQVDTKKALAAFIAANCIGVMMMYAIPLVVGSIADAFGVREGTAGIVSALEFGTMAAASLLLSTRFHRLNVRQLALVSVFVVVAGNAASVWTVYKGNWSIFLTLRGLIGLGEGALFAISNGMAAKTSNPERTFSFLAGWEVTISLVVIAGIAVLLEVMGPGGAYAALAAISLIVSPFLIWFPKGDVKTAEPETGTGKGLGFGRTIVVLFVAYSVLQLGMSMFWAFTERLGVSLGFPISKISAALFATSAFAILGPVLCGILGTRFGRAFPIAIGILISIAATLIMVYTDSFTWYAGTLIIAGMAMMYFFPLLSGLVAFYDPTGGANTALAGLILITTSIGPLIGGFLLNAGGSYRLLGWITVVMYAVMLVMVFRPARRADFSPDTPPCDSGLAGAAAPSA